MNVTVDLSDAADVRPPPGLPLDEWARTALRHAHEANLPGIAADGPWRLDVQLVSEALSAELNARYRGKNHATNVLSFSCELPDPVTRALPEAPLGDLAICTAIVKREAAAQAKAEHAHWAHMLVHGLLHLLGLDHESAEQASVMEAMEIRILAELGYPDPYDDPKDGTASGCTQRRTGTT